MSISFMELMRALVGWKNKGKCRDCGMNDAERVIVRWTKEQVDLKDPWPATGVCFSCGSDDLDRLLIGDLKKKAKQWVSALCGEPA